MYLFNCPGCGDATFELHLTRYNLCAGCEAKMEPTLELVVIFPDEVIRVNADESDLDNLAFFIYDVEDEGGTFVWQTRMVLRITSHTPEAVLI